MGNPAFDAALLLRGLRAMDAALGESYNVNNHTCIPQAVNYSSTFPEEGFNFGKYQGVEGLKGTWRSWMYEDAGKGQLKANVHPDVEETVVEAFSILQKCDKSKDGNVTKSEWETCQRGRSGNDQLWDIEFLSALYNVTGKMLILEKNQPLNPADPETYPELIQLRADASKMITDRDGKIVTLENDLGKTREAVALYQISTVGATGTLALVALFLGVRALWRGRSKSGRETPPPTNNPPADNPPPGNTPPPAAGANPSTRRARRSSAAAPAQPAPENPNPGAQAGTPPNIPSPVANAAAAAPGAAPAAPRRTRLDEALEGLDADDVVLTTVPTIDTLTVEDIKRQIRFFYPDLDNARHESVIQILSDNVLQELRDMNGAEYQEAWTIELMSYTDAIKGTAPSRYLQDYVDGRIRTISRTISEAQAVEMATEAERRSQPGRREEMREVFRRSMEGARNTATRR